MIAGVVAHDSDNARPGFAGVVQVGNAVAKARRKMQQGRGHITRSLRGTRGFFHVVVPESFDVSAWPLLTP